MKEADRVLRDVVEQENGVPGVVAMATDRKGNFYEGAAGKRELGKDQEMTTDTVFAIFSCTKAVTGVAVMQLVEEGEISLDDSVKQYVPEIADIHVLEGFDANGEPHERPSNSDVTVRQLMLHTAGFGYDFFNEDLLSYGEKKDVPSVITGTMASLRSVRLFDPGERWEYGKNIDWVGKVVEEVRGRRLGEVLAERIFEPLGMNETAFTMTEDMRAAGDPAPARRRRIIQPTAGLRAAAGPGTAHGWAWPVRHRRRLHEVHPYGLERWGW